MLNYFNSSTSIYFHPTIKSYPLQIRFGLPPNDTISFFFFFFFNLLLRETIIGFDLNEVREEIMLFILKEYDHWKIRLLEIYGCFSSSSSQKEKKIWMFKKCDHWKWKKKNQ